MYDVNTYPWEVTAKVLAKTLGVSERCVQQLREDGLFQNEKKARFDLRTCVQAYISYKVEAARGEREKTGTADEEKLKLTRAKRRIEEKKLQIIQGKLHRSDAVQAVMSRMLLNFKAKLSAIPTTLAPQLLAQMQLPVIQDILLEGINEALNELSEYDPEAFYYESDDEIVPDDLDDEEEEEDDA